MGRASRLLMTFVAAFAVILSGAQAQEYPTKVIKIVVPYAVGSPIELEARQLAKFMEPRLKQPVIVENRPGAAGSVGAEAVARSTPDGYTLLLTGASLAQLKLLQKNIGFDPIKDLTPISLLTDLVVVLITNKDVPANNWTEFTGLAKASPGKLNYASAGPGAILMGIEALKAAAAINVVEVPFTGQAAYLPALLRNEVQLTTASAASITQHLAAGNLKALMILGDQRIPQLPNIPTSAELGYAQTITSFGWTGLLAPAGTPKAILDLLAAEVAAYVKTPEIKDRAEKSIFFPVGSSPEDFRKKIETDALIWERVARAINLKPE